MPEDPAAPPQNRSWLQRNWRWIFPSSILLLVAFAGGLTLLILSIIMLPAKSSPIYTEALDQALRDPRVQQALGPPVNAGWYVRGRVETDQQGGMADITIPLEGRQRSGELHVLGRSEGGEWTITRMILEIEGSSNPLDLLAGKG